MKVPKFKVGQKVKVLRAPTKAEYKLWYDSWMPEMDFAIGNEYIIMRCISYGLTHGAVYCKYELNDISRLNFPGFVLQDTTIGKQLLFAFME